MMGLGHHKYSPKDRIVSSVIKFYFHSWRIKLEVSILRILMALVFSSETLSTLFRICNYESLGKHGNERL